MRPLARNGGQVPFAANRCEGNVSVARGNKEAIARPISRTQECTSSLPPLSGRQRERPSFPGPDRPTAHTEKTSSLGMTARHADYVASGTRTSITSSASARAYIQVKQQEGPLTRFWAWSNAQNTKSGRTQDHHSRFFNNTRQSRWKRQSVNSQGGKSAAALLRSPKPELTVRANRARTTHTPST